MGDNKKERRYAIEKAPYPKDSPSVKCMHGWFPRQTKMFTIARDAISFCLKETLLFPAGTLKVLRLTFTVRDAEKS